ncbi:hypothetical protein E8E13_005513 [Curvularia kusanoi]|uniref:FAD-binding domain-containing protein n=1 Tax=Curvularia kusanoi TaxID=90978 RepID=A0A9P4TCN2_CURKU|nr:hypothetical protein E8E13_005513 [Curvularia kusanoi]
MPSHPTTPKIAICGAGPVSLTLANILQNHSIPFTVYEASSSLRTWGGSLDLHRESGQAALREAGLWDAFTRVSRPESDVRKIVALDGTVLWDGNTCDAAQEPAAMEDDKYDGRPEIDRRALVALLAQNLAPDAVVFEHKVSSVIPVPGTAQHTLFFADTTTAGPFDLVIGGDGAWSSVRSLLSPTKPQYSGITMASASLSNIHTDPELQEYVGAGTLFAFGRDTALIAQRGDAGFLSVYACLRVGEGFVEECRIDWEGDAGTARERLMQGWFGHVDSRLRDVFLSARDELTPRKLYELPVGFEWAHRPGVTLMGDAAHLMTPFAGVGVNVGMQDALVLGREIVGWCEGTKGLDEAVRAYEEEMVPRAKQFAERTMKGKEGHFSEDGSEAFVKKLRAARNATKAG